MKKYIVGNWKMNMEVADIKAFLGALPTENSPFKCEAWIAPQALHVDRLLQARSERGWLGVGTQNCSSEQEGAFTGEISPRTIADIGATFTLVGHSERRQLFGEGHEVLNKKTHVALRNNLKVIFCIGETLEEREAGKTENVLTEQLKEGLKDIDQGLRDKIIVAYEPVWAIGTGKTATPEMAQEAHKHIRGVLSEIWDEKQAIKTPLLYGGSVKPDNVDGLLSQDDIDGGLVGGASLKAVDYLALCECASKLSN